MYYKSIKNKLDSIINRLNVNDTSPHIIIISLNKNNNGFKYLIKDNCCSVNGVANTTIFYVNDYQDYIDKANKKSVIIINDLDICD